MDEAEIRDDDLHEKRMARLKREHDEKVSMRAEIEQLRAALKPFGYYYRLNDCQDRAANDALEVPIADLRRAYDLVGGACPFEQTADGGK